MEQNDSDSSLWQKFSANIKPLSSQKNSKNVDILMPYIEKVTTGKDGIEKITQYARPITVVLQRDDGYDNHPLKHTKKTMPVSKLNALDVKTKDIGARLDLHGHRQASADLSLHRFFDSIQYQGIKYAIVITGKGDPTTGGSIIREFAKNWFQTHFEYVVSFCEAQPKDGGSGAFYVHVRRIRNYKK